MHETTKEVDTLRRLAELLRQANTAATDGSPQSKNQGPGIKKLRRGDPKPDRPIVRAKP